MMRLQIAYSWEGGQARSYQLLQDFILQGPEEPKRKNAEKNGIRHPNA